MPPGYVTLDGIDINDIWYGGAGILAAIDQYRAVDMPIIQSLALSWPEQLIKYGIGQKNGFQLLGPSQRPDRKMVEIAAVTPQVKKWGYGVGTDFDTLQRSTGREIMLALARPMKEDPENILLDFLRVMMTNPGTNNAGYGFYNGQFAAEEKITAPVPWQQNQFAASHTHYVTSLVPNQLSIADFTATKVTIRHHGNRGTIGAFCNSTTVQKLEDLAAWNQASIIRSPVSDLVAVQGFGETFQLVGITFHSTEMIPDGYILFVEINQSEDMRPLVMYEPANLKGLRLHPGPISDYPLVESFFDRWFGVKVLNRGAGVAMDFGAGHTGTYRNPTFV